MQKLGCVPQTEQSCPLRIWLSHIGTPPPETAVLSLWNHLDFLNRNKNQQNFPGSGRPSITHSVSIGIVFLVAGKYYRGNAAYQLVVLKYILRTALYLGFRVSLTTSFNFLLFFSHCEYKYLICFCSKHQLGVSIIFINTDLLLQGDCWATVICPAGTMKYLLFCFYPRLPGISSSLSLVSQSTHIKNLPWYPFKYSRAKSFSSPDEHGTVPSGKRAD